MEERTEPEAPHEEFLVLIAVGTDRPGIVADLTALLAERGANVADSRMAVLGGEFALIALVSATPGQLATVRHELRDLADRLGLQLIIQPTRSPAAHRAGRVRSYRVEVHALDHPGIVHAISQAVRELRGNVVTLETTAYRASVTGAPLFRMSLSADFPADLSGARLRAALDAVAESAGADVEVHPV